MNKSVLYCQQIKSCLQTIDVLSAERLTDSRPGSEEQFLQQPSIISGLVPNIILQAECSAAAAQCI